MVSMHFNRCNCTDWFFFFVYFDREALAQEYAQRYRDLLEQYKTDPKVSVDHLDLNLTYVFTHTVQTQGFLLQLTIKLQTYPKQKTCQISRRTSC